MMSGWAALTRPFRRLCEQRIALRPGRCELRPGEPRQPRGMWQADRPPTRLSPRRAGRLCPRTGTLFGEQVGLRVRRPRSSPKYGQRNVSHRASGRVRASRSYRPQSQTLPRAYPNHLGAGGRVQIALLGISSGVSRSARHRAPDEPYRQGYKAEPIGAYVTAGDRSRTVASKRATSCVLRMRPGRRSRDLAVARRSPPC
jgi:hypothetical protein